MKDELKLLKQSINSQYKNFLNENNQVKKYLENEIEEHTNSLRIKLSNKKFPYDKYDKFLYRYQKNYKNIQKDKKHLRYLNFFLPKYEDFINQTNLTKDTSYFEKEIKKSDKKKKNKINVTHQLFITKWKEKIDKLYVAWKLQILEEERKKFFSKIKEWIEYIQKLSKEIQSLGLETGYLLDFSEGNLSIQDIEQLKQWLEYFSKDEGIKKLCDLLGKMNSSSYIKKTEKKIEDIEVNVEKYYLEYSSKGEIIGLNIGKSIENVLPHELSFFADSDLSDLFELKYLENQLSIFDMASMQKQTETIIEQREKEYQRQEKEKKGPMIICVDTSGSMSGFPETIAKAITLFLSLEARKEKRNCYIINFSTQIETINLSKDYSIGNLIHFLKQSFHGGTDATPAILHSIETMKKEEYKKADMLIISDFIMSDLSSSIQNTLSQMRKEQNKFYALSIGNFEYSKKISSIFDKEWQYNPNTVTVEKLKKVKSSLFKRSCPEGFEPPTL